LRAKGRPRPHGVAAVYVGQDPARILVVDDVDEIAEEKEHVTRARLVLDDVEVAVNIGDDLDPHGPDATNGPDITSDA
jgi:hypothetical protein